MRTACAAALIVCAVALPARAQTAPERAPLPAPRPAADALQASPEEAVPEVEAASGVDAAATKDDEPAPDPNADVDEAADDARGLEERQVAAGAEDLVASGEALADTAAEGGELEGPPAPPIPQMLAESDLDLGICLGRLAALGTVYERGRAIAEEAGSCGIVNPLRVSEIVPGVALAPVGIMRCETAVALAEWVARFALPASLALPDRGRLVEVTHGSAYVCRGINNAAEGDLSEHAFGNAVDVMGFRFAKGAPISIEPREREGTSAEAFQRTVRAAACLGFTTVLGPGVEAHADHLHLDIKARENGYRLCQ